MIKYGYEIISCSKLDKNFVNNINWKEYENGRKKAAIQVKNTKVIDKETLLYIENIKKKYNIDLKISVIGPYNDEISKSDKTKERYFYNTLYDMDELYKIIVNFETIEESIDPTWDEFDIVVYLVDIIVRNIMYDPEYYLMFNKGKDIPKVLGEQDMADFYDRTLRGILRKKTVCAGYSVIFKELANRNGIECKTIFGKCYDSDGKNPCGHGWNLIKINGVVYPLDITKKNTKYRKGDFSNIEDLSCDVDEFNYTHRPYNDSEKYNLTRLPESVIKRSQMKTSNRRRYKSSTYIIGRYDGSKFLISQIGMYKGMYRYLYTEIKSDGSYEIPTIVFSESNFIKEINERNFEESSHFNDFLGSFANVLFSKENLDDSIKNKKTRYIGCCELSNKRGFAQRSIEIPKSSRAINTFNINNIRSQKRDDGTTVTIVQFHGRPESKTLYEYFVYELSDKGNVTEYNITSNQDYFSMQSSLVVNSILTNEKLEESARHNGVLR